MSAPPDTVAPVPGDAKGGITRTRGILGRLVLLAVIVLLLGQVVVAWFAVTGFEKALEPQLSQKAGAVGRAVSDQIAFVVDELGIPPGELVGVDPFLDKILESNADIEYLLMLDPSSEVQFARGLPPESLERVLPGSSRCRQRDGRQFRGGGLHQQRLPDRNGRSGRHRAPRGGQWGVRARPTVRAAV